MTLRPLSLLSVLPAVVIACAAPPPEAPPPPVVLVPPPPAVPEAPPAPLPRPSGPARLTAKPMPLPGATGPASLDYIACDRALGRVWVPVGSTGSVDVLDVASGNFTKIDGFKTAEREFRGKKRTTGPSAVTIGQGFAYVGNRATSEICPVDLATLKPAKCLKLSSPTDGVAYVESAKEVWVTTPKDKTLTVLDAKTPPLLAVKTTIKTDGSPEGYAVEDDKGLFFTNLEDKGGTVVIDVPTHKVKATWAPGCGADGPRGLAFDTAHDFLIVACTDHLQVLDAGHAGAPLGKLDTGEGVDNIDFVDGKVYVAAGKAHSFTVAAVDAKGQLKPVATGETSDGARNPVADARGDAYVADSPAARLLVFPAAR